MGRGSTQEPPCRPFDMSIFSALLSQSGINFQSNMYGSATSEPSSEQGRRKLTSHWSSRWINQFSCQFLMDCFVHERCIPQQNSQWCFWASVWRSCAWQIVCVIDSVWQSCVWKIVCDTVSRWKIVRDKVMCERLRVCVCVTKLCLKDCVCVIDSVWQSCVWQIVCDKVVCERLVCDKVVCVKGFCVKDSLWQRCVCGCER